MANKPHTVADGEWLAKIAFQQQTDGDKIWDDPGNQTIRASCPNPNLLCKGAKLQIPEPEKKEEGGATDAAYKFKVPGEPKAKLNLKLQEHVEKAMEEEYELQIGGDTFKGTAVGGEIKCEIPITSHIGLLRLPKRNVEIQIRVGSLNGVVPWQDNKCKIQGAQARLANLAFSFGPDGSGKTAPLAVDGVVGPKTTEATKRYQRWADTYSPGNGLASADLSKADKKLGPLTAGCLNKTHGV
jgi:peptidoglycan hydrolase-like protein with peptidoglycan-binding domain